NDVAAIQQFTNLAVATMTNSIFALFLALGIIFVLNWKLALFCLLILPFYYGVIRYFHPKIREDSHKFREKQSQVAGTLGEIFNGIKVVKSFAMEDLEMQRFSQMTKDNIRPELELSTRSYQMGSILGSFNDFVVAGLFIGGAAAVMGDQMTIGDYVAFTGYLGILFSPMMALSLLLQVAITAHTGMERICNILDIRPEIADRSGAFSMNEVKGHIEFEDVTFAYKEDRPAIRHFNLDVKPGEMIAVVGPSGSGKSTLMSLLTRFHDVSEGVIRLDGRDIRTLKYEEYRRNIGIVLQENFLFAGTIADNIRYGKPEASIREIRAAAEKANALEFIDELPDGLESVVGERGTQLSGGQRQRIAIARTLLKNPRILVFDEATSSLDTISEHLIQEALYGLVDNRTVFVIAHRLSTIQRADRIVVMEKGRIVEMGNHRELLKNGGVYSRMFNVQEVAKNGSLKID
ncbi:MAG: ABC transporter ATP-binding protein, partial [Chthoniobacterales bacterium]